MVEFSLERIIMRIPRPLSNDRYQEGKGGRTLLEDPDSSIIINQSPGYNIGAASGEVHSLLLLEQHQFVQANAEKE